MAAKTAPARTAAQHQSLLHFVGVASWSDANVLAKVRAMVLPVMRASLNCVIILFFVACAPN
jgi:SRSO17 transposase